MADPNDFLKAAIASYLIRLTDYALLVTGPWGSGKTYQVKNALKVSHSNHLYMSAAAAISSDELSFRLVIASAPFLGTKFANVTEQIVSGLLSRIKIDYKIRLADFKKIPADAVVVIDDLERFSGQPAVLLSFANSLVEQGGRKVILLAAENELPPDETNTFLRTKEKVVGQQLNVVPDPTSLIRGVLYRISPEYQKFLLENQDPLVEVFDRLGRGNLRSLKRFVFDFSPIYLALESGEKRIDQHDLVRLAQTLLAFTLAARRNDIDRALLVRRPENAFMALIEQAGNDELEPIVSIGRAVPQVDIYDPTIGTDLIVSFVFDGFVDPTIVERTRNDFLIGKGGGSAEPWRVLWHYLDVDEKEFAKALPQFLDRFFKRQFIEAGEVIHAFGILFELSEAKLIPYDQDQVSEMVEAYTDEIVLNRRFDLTLGGVMASHRHGSAYGLGFHQLQNSRMNLAITQLREKAEQKRQADLIAKFEQIFEPGRSFKPEVALEIMLGSQPSSSLRGVAFLQKVNAGHVARVIANAGPETQGSILRSISSRISQEQEAVADAERRWIPDLIQTLNDQIEKQKADLVKRRLSQMIDWYLMPLLNAGSDTKPPVS